MQIIRKGDALHHEKELGTIVDYHIFDEYEINVNEVPPGVTQDWHYHKVKEEVILINSGKIRAEWKEEGELRTVELNEGDLVRVEDTMHRFVNSFEEACMYVCFKLVLTGESKWDILAGDKYAD